MTSRAPHNNAVTTAGGGDSSASFQRSQPPQQASQQQQPDAAVPTLRVMRLQNPELFMPTAGTLDAGRQPMLNNALCLPDSLDVYVGETFTAYLGVVNASRHASVRRLAVTAQLQTPSRRWQLPSPLDGNNHNNAGNTGGYGMDVPPMAGVDAVVSHVIEEPGQHILRAEVSSLGGPDGDVRTFRKFYRFQVTYPVEVRTESVVRAGDDACLVTVSVEYTNNAEYASARDVMQLAHVEWRCPPHGGLTATMVGAPTTTVKDPTTESSSSLRLYDEARILQRGTVVRYLFRVRATSETARSRGLAAGDALGQAAVTWRKSMGEGGTVYGRDGGDDPGQKMTYCPPARVGDDDGRGGGPVFRSGLTVDVAAQRATKDGDHRHLTVTVEPIDPPRRMTLGVPTRLQFLVVNHVPDARALQLRFRSGDGGGLAVYGASGLSLGVVPGAGGSRVATVNFVALTAGLLRLGGCHVVDHATDTAIAQPPLLDVFVDHEAPRRQQ